jgi:trans-aconitate methyltransferase
MEKPVTNRSDGRDEIGASHFDRRSAEYRDARPGYPPELYADVASLKAFSGGDTLLDVGAGTGVATRELFASYGSRVVALEPGSQLAAIARAALASEPRASLVESTFESYEPGRRFQGLFSATAFHWLDPAVKYAKARALLDSDGLLVLYWNYYALSDESERAIRPALAKRGFKAPAGAASAGKILARRNEIESSGLFSILLSGRYERALAYDPARYLALLATFPDFSAIVGAGFDSLSEDVNEVCVGVRDGIGLRVTTALEVARQS